MLTLTTPSSSSSSSSSWVSNLSPTLLIYLSFALTLFTHTVLLNITAQDGQHASSYTRWLHSSSPSPIPVPGGPQVHWDDVPAVIPHTPQPLQPATSPDAPLSDDDMSRLSDSSGYYPVNDDPVRCSRMLGQLMSSRTRDGFFENIPQTCAYMAYEKFDDRGRGRRKGESIRHEEEEVLATLVST